MSGSGGGGGSSSPPEYARDTHMDWLTRGHQDTPMVYANLSMVEAMNNAFGAGNPLQTMRAADPDKYLSEMRRILEMYRSDVSFKLDTWNNSVTEQAMAIFDESQQDHLDTKVLPAYRAAARDAGSINTSYYAVGEAIIRRDYARERARMLADLLLQSSRSKEGWEQACIDKLAHYGIEVARMSIAAKSDEQREETTLRVKQGRWDLETFAYGGNLLAAISGGVTSSPGGANVMGSTLGGALSGAAVGAQVGSAYPVVGTAIGAVVGAAAGFFGAKG